MWGAELTLQPKSVQQKQLFNICVILHMGIRKLMTDPLN